SPPPNLPPSPTNQSTPSSCSNSSPTSPRPTDPVLAAKARFFIHAVSTKLTPAYISVIARGEDPKVLLDELEAIQALLPKSEPGREQYAIVDQWTIADAAFGVMKKDWGGGAYKVLSTDEKFERIREYMRISRERESFRASFDEAYILEVSSKRLGGFRAKIQAGAKACNGGARGRKSTYYVHILRTFHTPTSTASMPPSRTEVKSVAQEVVETVRSLGYECCLFGSAAAMCYGMNNRVPEDVDLIVLTTTEPERIKTQIVSTNPSKYYLVNSANPQNTYRILWSKLSSDAGTSSISSTATERSCKVDILVPGLLSIPQIPSAQITYTPAHPTLPVIPLLALILLKLRGWDDHKGDYRQRMIDKTAVDEGDIEELLRIAVRRGGGGKPISVPGERWLPRWFVREATNRVEYFVEEKPETKDHWMRLGFTFSSD
ncbi:hypothetical protein AX16_006830, partial [Volvariella volvacea WC 439]